MSAKEIHPLMRGLTGEIHIPGDKSISHRSIMLSALGNGPVHIKNFLHGQDCLSTLTAFDAMGVQTEFLSETELLIHGVGLHGLKKPEVILNAGNSGTTLRLMLGIMAGQKFPVTFTGDSSLKRRPMNRVIDPLNLMGANIVGSADNRHLPIKVSPSEGLTGMVYDMPVASAQVKSAILLAAMYADSPTTVIENQPSRDHTERIMQAFGANITRRGLAITVQPVTELVSPTEISVPGDISSAAYFIVAATIIKGSNVLLKNVGINPTRTGIIDVLKNMGANIEIINKTVSGGEEAADIRVRSAALTGTSFGAAMIPRLIDEVPIIAVAAAFAQGDTIITGAQELRVKETDRIEAVANEVNKLMPGAVESLPDGLKIHGGQNVTRAHVTSYDDHRMAMSLTVCAAAGAGAAIENPECVDISYPGFFATWDSMYGNSL